MDFTASNGMAGGSYEKPKPGSYYGVLVGFAEVGTHDSQFGAKQKVMLRWELHRRKGPVLDEAGGILTTIQTYNQSFDVKSSLRSVIEAHIGPVEDGRKVSSRDWLGKSARLVLKESTDKKYVNVETVTPLDPEEDEAPKQVEASEHWEMKDDALAPPWCKWKVERSQEWEQVHGKAPAKNGTPAMAGAGIGTGDDQPPF
jgi:hypothetical protein